MTKFYCDRQFGVPYLEFEEPIHDVDELSKTIFDLFYESKIDGTTFGIVMKYNYEFEKNTEWWMKEPTVEYAYLNLTDFSFWWLNDWDEGQTIIDIYGFFDLDHLERFTDNINDWRDKL